MEVHSRIGLDADSGGVLHVVLQSQVSIERLQVIRQAVVRAAEIIAFVFDAGSKVPVSLDPKPMVVTKIVINRIPMTEFGFLKIALERVRRFVGKQIV